jgi:hypothetical protein
LFEKEVLIVYSVPQELNVKLIIENDENKQKRELTLEERKI